MHQIIISVFLAFFILFNSNFFVKQFYVRNKLKKNLRKHGDIFISVNDNIELESRSDGQRYSKFWVQIQVELMLFLVWVQSFNSLNRGLCIIYWRL